MRILAVDDDPIILELVAELLVTFGHHDVDTAGSAAEALEIVGDPQSDLYDCFLLDIQMPEMDGIQLCRKLRETSRYVRTPILMITAMSDKAYIDNAFSAGATDYVTKPFDINELRERITTAEARIAGEGALTKKIFAVSRGTEPQEQVKVALNEPVTIMDVDGVIDYFAFENYVSQLSRGSLFGSTVFGFAIRGIASLYRQSTAFGFECLITDTAEAISDCLQGNQFLITYAGNGAFICVVEGGYRPDLERLTDMVNLCIHDMDLHFCDGRKLDFRVAPGEAQRMIWRGNGNAMEAVILAHQTAEDEALRREKMQNDFWLTERAG
ncbi:response regulator [Albibacillus kandeliae]|uniref:response regulator n=1 Tax=Albibacillus kandeliae TaxID=2174228 RepID=UPI000D6885F7|nr:response regulator [Albibacillus kandeliae]